MTQTQIHVYLVTNKLESANFGVDIPCFHWLFKGAAFPNKPQIDLNLENQYDKFIIEKDIIENSTTSIGGLEDQINYVASTIKYFSHYKKDEEIKNFVEKNTNNEECYFFILNQKVSVVDLIEERIFYFKRKKNSST